MTRHFFLPYQHPVYIPLKRHLHGFNVGPFFRASLRNTLKTAHSDPATHSLQSLRWRHRRHCCSGRQGGTEKGGWGSKVPTAEATATATASSAPRRPGPPECALRFARVPLRPEPDFGVAGAVSEHPEDEEAGATAANRPGKTGEEVFPWPQVCHEHV